MCNVIHELPVTAHDIRMVSADDNHITRMKKLLNNKQNKNTNSNNFSLRDDVLMYAQRVVVPTALQKQVLREFHSGYPRMSRMKALMKSYVYWPSMHGDIENCVKSCRGCVLAAKVQVLKYQSWPEMDSPWSRVHINYAGPVNGAYYLIADDSSTKWPRDMQMQLTNRENNNKVIL
eukprot:XP_014788182.1 PREDICTED: uncharacterized protein K02A2.6-like [Octopus bimaculoides]